MGNNFPYRNFSKFGLDFEFKFKEALGVWIQMNFDKFGRNFQNCCNLDWETLIELEWQLNSWERVWNSKIWDFLYFCLKIQMENYIWIPFSLSRIWFANGFNAWLRD
jgi:hypothetical protein